MVFGTHNGRYCSGFLTRKEEQLLLTTSVGPTIVEWNLALHERRTLIPALPDFVVQLQRVTVNREPLILVCSYGGSVTLWRQREPWQTASNTLQVGFDIDNAQLRGNQLAVFGEATDGTGRVALVSIHSITGNLELKVERIWQGRYPHGFFHPRTGELTLFEQQPQEIWLHSSLLSDQPQAVCYLSGELDVFVLNETGTIGLLGCRHRRVVMLDLMTSLTVWIARIPGSGIFKTLQMKGSRVLCPTDGGRFFFYDVTAVMPTAAASIEEPALPPFREFSGPSGMIHLTDWIEDGYGSEAQIDLVICNDFAIAHKQIRPDASDAMFDIHEMKIIKYHELTCCGIDIRSSDNAIIAGDFTGQVLLWQSHAISPQRTIAITEPVRSVRFLPSGKSILIGDVSGHVHHYSLDQPAMTSYPWLRLDGTVTCIDLLGTPDVVMVACACTDGNVTIATLLNDQPTDQGDKLTWLAHAPIAGPQDLRFGSIGKFSEVWSLVWAPAQSPEAALLLATASEDQTVVIWQLDKQQVPTRTQTLRGHEAAVTCVSWTLTRAAGSLFISASDDRTVRVYDGSTWALCCVLSSNGYGLQWHTLTYCALVADTTCNGDRVAIAAGSSNGYILIWSFNQDASSWSNVFVRKIHAGSVEGLAAHRVDNVVASCASDCTIHVTKVPNERKDSFK